MNKRTLGVNDPKPTWRPANGMRWTRIKGGPRDGQWVQIAVEPQYLGTDNDGLACYQLPFQL